jgi:hypothetical protein
LGYFVRDWGSTAPPETCQLCEPETQLCDQLHQRVPKPATTGIWIDPSNGDAVSCEPFSSCVKHTTVEAVLTGECEKGYTVRPLPPAFSASRHCRRRSENMIKMITKAERISLTSIIGIYVYSPSRE